MNIPKAIEILNSSYDTRPSIKDSDFDDALSLGIEALNYVLECRVKDYHPVKHALPGETK